MPVPRYQLPTVSTPIEDNDIANKKYVDDSLRAEVGFLVSQFNNNAANTKNYIPPGSQFTSFATGLAADAAIQFPYGITLKRIFFLPLTNTKDGTTLFELEDNGTPISNTELTMLAADLTFLDTGVITEAVAANRKISLGADRTASTSGAIIGMHVIDFQKT